MNGISSFCSVAPTATVTCLWAKDCLLLVFNWYPGIPSLEVALSSNSLWPFPKYSWLTRLLLYYSQHSEWRLGSYVCRWQQMPLWKHDVIILQSFEHLPSQFLHSHVVWSSSYHLHLNFWLGNLKRRNKIWSLDSLWHKVAEICIVFKLAKKSYHFIYIGFIFFLQIFQCRVKIIIITRSAF